MERRSFAEQLVGSHHGVDGSLLQAIENGFAFRRRPETIQQSHLDRIRREAFRERAPVLLSQHRGWGQHRHLFSSGDGFEDGADRNFGLAEANVPAHQSVHRLLPFHVPFHVGRGLQLIRRRVIGERLLHFHLPGAVGGEGKACGLLPFCVQLHQIKGNLANRLLGPFLGLVPGRATHAVELRGCFTRGPITPKAAELIGGNPKDSIGVLHHEVVADVA